MAPKAAHDAAAGPVERVRRQHDLGPWPEAIVDDGISVDTILNLIDWYVGPRLGPFLGVEDEQARARRTGRAAKTDQAPQPDDLISPVLEMALISAAIQDPNVLALPFDPMDFHDHRLTPIWNAAQALARKGQPCDLVLILEQLQANGQHPEPGLVWQIKAAEATPDHAAEYAARVHDLALRRRALTEMQNAAAVIRDCEGSWASLLPAALGRVTKLTAAAQSATVRIATGWSAAELLATNFPDPQWAVPGLIPEGLSFLGGRPKVGKSYLVLQIAIAKGTGGRVFDRQVEAGAALYLALEDNGRRLRERATRQGMPASAQVRFETSWPPLMAGGLSQLEQAIDADKYKLVIIDTLGRVAGKVDMDNYGETTALLGSLQELALSRNIAIVVVDHHRKGALGMEDNPVDAILGSTGKSGAADAVLGLTRQQGKPGARLQVKGRELEELDLVLTWDRTFLCWQCQGTAEEVELSGRRGQVLSILQHAYPRALLAGEIAQEAEMSRQKVIPLLNDLIREGHATKEPKQGREQPYRAMRSQDEQSG